MVASMGRTMADYSVALLVERSAGCSVAKKESLSIVSMAGMLADLMADLMDEN